MERQRIEQLAYERWQQRGCPEGSAEDDWLEAERQASAIRGDDLNNDEESRASTAVSAHESMSRELGDLSVAK